VCHDLRANWRRDGLAPPSERRPQFLIAIAAMAVMGWSDLMTELLMDIVDRIIELTDIVRLCVVCSSWCAVSLFLSSSSRHFFSPRENRIYLDILLPLTSPRKCTTTAATSMCPHSTSWCPVASSINYVDDEFFVRLPHRHLVEHFYIAIARGG
jgi:hypothetical protein